MEAKNKAIQEAYGKHWENVKNYVDENGWCYLFPTIKGELDFENTGRDNVCYRPKSLQGIENNNGWIKLNTQSDLKHKMIDCYFMSNDELINGEIYNYDFYYGNKYFNFSEVTHYKPIAKPKLPLF